MSKMCVCGKPLHYLRKESRKAVERLIAVNGEYIEVSTPDGTWKVPRHYIALHGRVARELPTLARLYGFERISPVADVV
jgi:hypothetical protein